MSCLARGFSLLLGLVLTGCVIVPVPGSVERVDLDGAELSKAALPPLESPEEGVVVLSTTMSYDDHGTAHCVRKALQSENPQLRVVSAREFRDALFPWLDLQAGSEELRARLSDPLLRKAIAEFNVRYAIFVSEQTQRTRGTAKGSIQYVGSGVGWVVEEMTLSASAWDVKRAQDLGSVRARASGSEGMIGVAIMGVVWVSDTEGAACRGLGERLGRVLTPGER